MRINILLWLVLVCLATNIAAFVNPDSRGILSNFVFNKTEEEYYMPPKWPGENHDICDRPFPLASNNRQRLATQFKRASVVPLIIPVPPRKLLNVEYRELSDCQPYLGNYVNVCGLTDAPKLKWNCKSNKKYTIWLIDIYPLGESRPSLLARGVLWWVVDIPGCNVDAGKTLYEYQPPLPLYGSGQNLYAIGVFEQPEYDIDWSEESHVPATSEKHRYYQGPVLILKYNVQLVAANFFYTEFKSCVEDGLFKLDDPSPQYVAKTVERANLPPDPYVLFARGAKHFSLNADTVQFQALFSREKGHKMHLEKDGSF